MPYIDKMARRDCKVILHNVAHTSGELNYQLTMVISAYLSAHGLSYATCNDIIGALDNCKDEFRRRIQHSYEDKKIAENGDVYITEPEKWSSEECTKCGGHAGGSDDVCLSCALEENNNR